VLLEVVLALILFVGAAAVISSGMTASVAAVERQKLNTHAVNLAVSLLSELQMGRYPLENAGPTPWETPFEDWTWQIEVESTLAVRSSEFTLKKATITIRHESQPITYRLTQRFPPPNSGASDTTTESPAAFSPALPSVP
jgi:type II secretory pathway pseudopilin PulG